MFGLFGRKRRKTFERVVERAQRDKAAPTKIVTPKPKNRLFMADMWDTLTPEQRRACMTGEPLPPPPPRSEEVGEGVERISVPGGWIYFKKGQEAPVFVPASDAAKISRLGGLASIR